MFHAPLGTNRKCWGEGFASLSARGVIQKVKIHRKTQEPRFEIKFPEKNQKTFVGFDLDYVMAYSEEVPLKYHPL